MTGMMKCRTIGLECIDAHFEMEANRACWKKNYKQDFLLKILIFSISLVFFIYQTL